MGNLNNERDKMPTLNQRKSNNLLGQLFRGARIKRNLTQAELAKQFNYTSPQFCSNWERGLVVPPTNILPKLCKLLKVDTKEVTTILLKKRAAELKAIFKN